MSDKDDRQQREAMVFAVTANRRRPTRRADVSRGTSEKEQEYKNLCPTRRRSQRSN